MNLWLFNIKHWVTASRVSSSPGFAWLPWAAALCFGVLAGLELRQLGQISHVDIPVADSKIFAQEDSICGELSANLPPLRLGWDGQPARAQLVDAATGTVLGPTLLSAA